MEGTLRFTEIDNSIGPEQRSLFGPAAPKKVYDLPIEFNDARTDPRIVKGPEGLDTQGFAYIKHRSVLQNSDQWFTERTIEDVYVPEICELVCKVTGAKKAMVNNTSFRRKLVDLGADPYFYVKSDSPLAEQLGKIPRDKALVIGREEGSLMEPIRGVHVDYTVEGLRRTIRECRNEMTEMAKEAIAAEDAKARGEHVEVPRYATYTVWRPLKTVRRDPLAVCDYRTFEKDTVSKHEYRHASQQNASGEYLMEYLNVGPSKDPKQSQWYYMPEQSPEDVLIIKLADTAAEIDPDIAAYGAHASPAIRGVENEEKRQSVECRVVAFW